MVVQQDGPQSSHKVNTLTSLLSPNPVGCLRDLQVSLCVHSVCRCGRQKPNSVTRARLLEIFQNNKLKS